jgi:Family of unknown function (DUF6424)
VAHEHAQEHPVEHAMDAAGGTHTEREDHPWEISIPDHPRRSDSPEYVQSRRKMNEIAREAFNSADSLLYGGPAYQDHHGAGHWLKDDAGWFLVRGLAGLEWSGQFAAEPAKVDALRVNAKRLYAAFPGAVEALGIRELLDTPITDHEGVARWTDSICNASVPLSAGMHTGIPGPDGGVHHFPAPVTELQFTKRDDFNLWVTDEEGNPAAVAPMSHRGSGDARVHVIYSHPGSKLHEEHRRHREAGTLHVLEADHPLAQQAFARQADG